MSFSKEDLVFIPTDVYFVTSKKAHKKLLKEKGLSATFDSDAVTTVITG